MKLHPIPVKQTTVNMATGEVVEEKTVNFGLVPAPPGVCAECAVDHPQEAPHNAQSLFYQYKFYGERGRWPTWADALSHCPPAVQAAWKAELQRLGAWTEPKPEDVK